MKLIKQYTPSGAHVRDGVRGGWEDMVEDGSCLSSSGLLDAVGLGKITSGTKF